MTNEEFLAIMFIAMVLMIVGTIPDLFRKD